MHNQLSPQGAHFMRLHEGFRAKWYLDPVGIPTIGIGFTWRSDAFREWWQTNKPGQAFARGATITRAEAQDALIYLCTNEYGKAVDAHLGKKVARHVFDGAVSPVYNMGVRSLQWRWGQALKRGKIKLAAAELLSTGITATNPVTQKRRKLAGLVRRRHEEALLLEKGVYTGVGNIVPSQPVNAMSDGVLERGEAGPEVAELIRDLDQLGYYDGILDDVFGHGTQAAVMDLQEEHSITRDGVAGPETLGLISDLLGKKAPEKAPSKPKAARRSLWNILTEGLKR